MESILKLLESNPYISYSVAVVLLTAAVRKSFFSESKLGPKWVTLLVAVVLATAFFLMHWIDLETSRDFFILISYLGAAVVFYDYVLKIVFDLLEKKNPLTGNPIKPKDE